MRIWFDISNSPHVNMFHGLINDLKSEGHEIIITSRPLANTIQLLNQNCLEHTPIGKHYGKNIILKLLGYPIRVLQLYHYLKRMNVDIAVSQSSFHSPLVACLLSVPSIYTNDNEHAKGNIISFIFATKILLPRSIKLSFFQQWIIRNKKVLYEGIKEGMYLWRKMDLIKNKIDNRSKTTIDIFIRPEPQTAQYYNVRNNILDEIIIQLQEKYRLTILVRSKSQYHHFRNDRFKNISVLEQAIPFDEIVLKSDLFIGAGGSMTRELALMGLPTISIYQSTLLSVDELLIEKGLMYYMPQFSIEIMEEILNKNSTIISKELIQEGKSSFDLMKKYIVNISKYSN